MASPHLLHGKMGRGQLLPHSHQLLLRRGRLKQSATKSRQLRLPRSRLLLVAGLKLQDGSLGLRQLLQRRSTLLLELRDEGGLLPQGLALFLELRDEGGLLPQGLALLLELRDEGDLLPQGLAFGLPCLATFGQLLAATRQLNGLAPQRVSLLGQLRLLRRGLPSELLQLEQLLQQLLLETISFERRGKAQRAVG